MQCDDIDPAWEPGNQSARAEQGGQAMIGIENASGTTAFQYTLTTRTLHTGGAIVFRPPT